MGKIHLILAIERSLNRRIKQEQKTVKVRELIVNQYNPSSPKVPQGEFVSEAVVSGQFNAAKSAKETEDQVIHRMVKHVEDLCEVAAKTHMEDNFERGVKHYISPKKLAAYVDDQVKLKYGKNPTEEQIQKEKLAIEQAHKIPVMDPDKKNQITRLSLNEFSLYPSAERGPLSVKGLNILLKAIEKLAKRYPDNLHLLLATVPVIINGQDVKNIGIYVECGEIPRIHPFAKAMPSTMDPVYPQTTLEPFAHVKPDSYGDLNIPGMTSLHDQTSSLNMQYGGNVICKTAGGTHFRVAVDICLDHRYKIAKTRAKQEVKLAQQNGDFVLPFFASHMLTSNPMLHSDDALIADVLTHADPVHAISQKGVRIADQIVAPELAYEIRNPEFGSLARIDVYPQQALAGHSKNLGIAVSAHNQFTVGLHALHVYRARYLKDLDYVDTKINKHIVKPIMLKLRELNLHSDYRELLVNVKNRRKLIQLVKKVGKKTDKISQDLIYITVSLLNKEKHATQNIRNQLADMHIDKGFISSHQANRDKSTPVVSKQVAVLGARDLKRLSHSGNDNSEHEFKAPANNTFAQPLSWMESTFVIRYLTQYSLFTLPWNKESRLSANDINVLNESLELLDSLEKDFEVKKTKRAYRYGVNANQYADVETLFNSTKAEIQEMLNQGIKTNARFNAVQENCKRIQTMLPKLTTPVIEKALKREEIKDSRLFRRRQRSGVETEPFVFQPRSFFSM